MYNLRVMLAVVFSHISSIFGHALLKVVQNRYCNVLRPFLPDEVITASLKQCNKNSETLSSACPNIELLYIKSVYAYIHCNKK